MTCAHVPAGRPHPYKLLICKALLAERVGFVPVVPSPINDLGLIRSPQITKSTQSLSIRYKTGTAILRRLPALTLQCLVQIPLLGMATAHEGVILRAGRGSNTVLFP